MRSHLFKSIQFLTKIPVSITGVLPKKDEGKGNKIYTIRISTCSNSL